MWLSLPQREGGREGGREEGREGGSGGGREGRGGREGGRGGGREGVREGVEGGREGDLYRWCPHALVLRTQTKNRGCLGGPGIEVEVPGQDYS